MPGMPMLPMCHGDVLIRLCTGIHMIKDVPVISFEFCQARRVRIQRGVFNPNKGKGFSSLNTGATASTMNLATIVEDQVSSKGVFSWAPLDNFALFQSTNGRINSMVFQSAS